MAHSSFVRTRTEKIDKKILPSNGVSLDIRDNFEQGAVISLFQCRFLLCYHQRLDFKGSIFLYIKSQNKK